MEKDCEMRREKALYQDENLALAKAFLSLLL